MLKIMKMNHDVICKMFSVLSCSGYLFVRSQRISMWNSWTFNHIKKLNVHERVWGKLFWHSMSMVFMVRKHLVRMILQ